MPRPTSTTLLAAVAATALVALPFPAARGQVPAEVEHDRSVRLIGGWLPYWENNDKPGSGWRAVREHLGQIDQVSLFSAEAAGGDGALTLRLGPSDPALNSEIATLHESGVAVWLTVTRMSDVHALLADPAALQTLSNGIVAALQRYNLDGVDIDFEDFHDHDPGDAALYTRFLTGLAVRLHRQPDSFDYPISVAATILPRTQRGKFTYTDEAALAASPVDQVRIMAYDDYWPGSPTAGANAPLPWVQTVAAYLRGTGAPMWKFIVGVPSYGDRWTVVSDSDWTTTDKGKSVTFPKAMAQLADHPGSARWDADGQAPYLSYTDADGQRTIAFYEDARSLASKVAGVLDSVAIPADQQPGGLAEWAFGYEDPAAWPMLRRRLAAAYPVYGVVGLCYARFGGGARFGQPLQPESDAGPVVVPAWNARAGRRQQFERGTLYYKWGDPRAYYVTGALERAYDRQGAASGALGFPAGDPQPSDDGRGMTQTFEHGTLSAGSPGAAALVASAVPVPSATLTITAGCAGFYLAGGALATGQRARQKPTPGLG